MTAKQAADQGVACPTIASALDQRFVSFLKDDRTAASEILTGPTEVPQYYEDIESTAGVPRVHAGQEHPSTT